MIIELRAKKLIGIPLGNHCSNVNERTDRKKKIYNEVYKCTFDWHFIDCCVDPQNNESDIGKQCDNQCFTFRLHLIFHVHFTCRCLYKTMYACSDVHCLLLSNPTCLYPVTH